MNSVMTVVTSSAIALIVGVSSSYVSTIVTISSIKTKIVYIEDDINEFDSIRDKVISNGGKIDLALERIKNLDEKLGKIENNTGVM